MELVFNGFIIKELMYKANNFTDNEVGSKSTTQISAAITEEEGVLALQITSDIETLSEEKKVQREIEITLEYIFEINYSNENEVLSSDEENIEYYTEEINKVLPICESMFNGIIKSITSIDYSIPITNSVLTLNKLEGKLLRE